MKSMQFGFPKRYSPPPCLNFSEQIVMSLKLYSWMLSILSHLLVVIPYGPSQMIKSTLPSSI